MTIHWYPLIAALVGLAMFAYCTTPVLKKVGAYLLLAGLIAVLLAIGGPAWRP